MYDPGHDPIVETESIPVYVYIMCIPVYVYIMCIPVYVYIMCIYSFCNFVTSHM